MSTLLGKDIIELTQVRVRRERREALKAAGYTNERLARELGISYPMMSMVLSNQRRAAWLRVGIVKLIGANFREFWGEEEPGLKRKDKKRLRKAGIEVE